MDELKRQLKQQIIEVLSLEEINPEDIVDSEPLFGEGLGLDSIDALELIVLMEKNYGIRLNNPAEGKAIFASLDTMDASAFAKFFQWVSAAVASSSVSVGAPTAGNDLPPPPPEINIVL